MWVFLFWILFCFSCFSKWTTQERNQKCYCPFTSVRRLLLVFVESSDSEDFTTKTNKLWCWICFLSVPFFCFPQTWLGSWLGHVPPCVRNPWPFASLYFFIHKLGVKIWTYCPASSQGFNRIPCENPITVLARGRCSIKSSFLHFCLLLLLSFN